MIFKETIGLNDVHMYTCMYFCSTVYSVSLCTGKGREVVAWCTLSVLASSIAYTVYMYVHKHCMLAII